MLLSGLFSSCATPAVNSPSVASFAVCTSCAWLLLKVLQGLPIAGLTGLRSLLRLLTRRDVLHHGDEVLGLSGRGIADEGDSGIDLDDPTLLVKIALLG